MPTRTVPSSSAGATHSCSAVYCRPSGTTTDSLVLDVLSPSTVIVSGGGERRGRRSGGAIEHPCRGADQLGDVERPGVEVQGDAPGGEGQRERAGGVGAGPVHLREQQQREGVEQAERRRLADVEHREGQVPLAP